MISILRLYLHSTTVLPVAGEEEVQRFGDDGGEIGAKNNDSKATTAGLRTSRPAVGEAGPFLVYVSV